MVAETAGCRAAEPCWKRQPAYLAVKGGESSLDSDSVLMGLPRLIDSSVGGAPSRTGKKNTFLRFVDN